jgi:hypothetical protein
MWRRRLYITRLNNDFSDSLKGFESTTAIDVCALVVALFGFFT